MTKVLRTEKMPVWIFPEIMLRMLLQSSGPLSLNGQFKIKEMINIKKPALVYVLTIVVGFL